MNNENFTAPLDLFSEYAMSVESDEYPKADWTQFQFRGKVDFNALSQAYDEALARVPIFSSHLTERREGITFTPYWVYDNEVKNKLHMVDCRHYVKDGEFDPLDFTTWFYSERVRRRIDLTCEFPFNCTLIRVRDDRYIFSILYHHSALDPNKAFKVLTHMMIRYHELVKGEKPDWGEAVVGMAALKRSGGYVKPVPFGPYAKAQLNDIWIKNRKGTISDIACEKQLDYRQEKGRYSLREVYDDPKFIEALMGRVSKNGATLNDLAMACFRKTLTEWNRERGVSDEKFRFMLVTSLKGRTELPENAGAGLSALNWVSHNEGDEDLDTLTQRFRDIRKEQLAQGIDILGYKLLAKFVEAARYFPMGLRRKLFNPLSMSLPVTVVLSNLGVVWPKYVDGRPTMESVVVNVGDFVIEDVHSSASPARNLGVALFLRTFNKKIYFNFVADRWRFREQEARDLCKAFAQDLYNAV